MQSSNTFPHRIFISPMQKSLIRTLLIVFAVVAAPHAAVHAEAPVLSLPVDCRLGVNCWLVNHVDHDPGPAARDYRCGALSYNTHKGTDFAIADDGVMRLGITVRAAASGVVLNVRDGMRHSTPADLESATALRGRECGNGVVIDHGNQWTTQYCHLKAGSLAVNKGDRVKRGAIIGEIGRSGRTEFPHLHMTVREATRVIDPFTGTSNLDTCSADAVPTGLWAPSLRDALAYPGPQPYHTGFAAGRPRPGDIQGGRLEASQFPSTVPALVFWAEVFSLAAGDRVSISLTAPDGSLVADNNVTINRPLARWHGFSGRNRRGDNWDKGHYTGRITVQRGDATVEKSATAVVQ